MKKLPTLIKKLSISFILNSLVLKIHSIIPQLRFYFFLKNRPAFDSTRNNQIAFIIFSKDRCLQLDSLLSSLYCYIKGTFEVHVLYATENDRYGKAYEQLIEERKNTKLLYFYKQRESFKESLKQILSNTVSTRVFFLVDDLLFKNHFDLTKIDHINPDKEIFSLRHGNHLNYCYAMNKTQPLPIFTQKEFFLQWKWNRSTLDWAYPLSVDGHLFNKNDAFFWAENLSYKAPNSFETALQCFKKYYENLSGICCCESIIFNNPCNKVQTEVSNVHGQNNSLSQLALLKLWEQGYRIDFNALEGFPNISVHQEVSFPLINKKKASANYD